MRRDEPSYTASRRAATRCVRELEKLRTDIILGAKQLDVAGIVEKAVIRQSPNRVIVQLGGVALTIAWLQSPMSSVATGELLVILWSGDVMPAPAGRNDRSLAAPSVRSATALWESVMSVAAEDDDTWRWCSSETGDAGFSTTDLAAHCIERLRIAYSERSVISSPATQ